MEETDDRVGTEYAIPAARFSRSPNAGAAGAATRGSSRSSRCRFHHQR